MAMWKRIAIFHGELWKMDISFGYENHKFNYRACAMMISEHKILAMHDERSPFF